MWDQMSVRNTEHPIIDQEVLKCEKWKQERRLLSVTTLKVSWHPGSCPWFQLDPIISLTLTTCIWGFPGGSADKESTWQCRRRRSHSWVRKIPWRRKWQPTPVFLPGKSHGQRDLVGYSPWGCKWIGHDLVTKQQHCTQNWKISFSFNQEKGSQGPSRVSHSKSWGVFIFHEPCTDWTGVIIFS